MEFEVLILGSDANAYYMARCYHEIYNKKAYVLVKSELAFTKYSNILNIIYNDKIWDEKNFIEAIRDFKKSHGKKRILLISSNETYVLFISKNRNMLLKENFIFNYPNVDLIETLIEKDKFYKTYRDSCLDLPNTIYFDCKCQTEAPKYLLFPVILKPSNVIMYNHINFQGKNKIYKINDREELQNVITKIIDSGYDDILIVQDYIPGDDSYLFDAVVYADKNKKVKLVSFAQIGLQEHTKNMVGNAAVLINGYNQYGGTEEIISKIKKFIEDIGYQGFAEFDLKYDYRDNKFKVLEINARQGRCSYYITPLGYNLVKVMINDLIYNEKMEYKVINKKQLLSFVPLSVAKKYIVNEEFKKEMLLLWKHRVNPLKYSKDTDINRKVFLIKKDIRYKEDYKNGYWKA